MGIRAFMALLIFCTDLLAWPAIALGYPLFASIRAVETGSKYHMKKLVIYWTLFSLFSLFEFAFVKIIDRLPLWSSIKLVVIFWLVVPRFDGACCVYEDLVRPILVVKLNVPQAAQCDTEILEAAEMSAAATMTHQVLYAESTAVNLTDEPTNVKETTPSEASGNNRRPKTPPFMEAQQEWTCDLCKVRAVGESVLNAHLQGRKHKSKVESLKASMLGAKNAGPSPLVQQKQSVSAAKVKESIPPKETTEKRCQEMPHLKKAQQAWTCDLCKVTTSSEIMLNGHLLGSKHKAKLETLKSSKLGLQVTGPSNSATSALNCGYVSEKFIKESGSEVEKTITSKVLIKAKETTPSEASAENIHAETPSLKQAQKEYTCDLCKVRTTSEKTLNAHFMGSKHKAKLDSAPWIVNVDGVLKKTEISNQYWCVLCNLKLRSHIDLLSHLVGKRHSSNLKL